MTEDEKSDRRALVLWYFDHWLPAAAGVEAYGTAVRYYIRATKASNVKVGGKTMPVVPVQAEAFAMLVFKNCEMKWQHIIPKKAKDPSWEVPNYKKDDPSTHDYHKTRWSSAKTGKQKKGGWDDAAMLAFKELLTQFDRFRKADAKRNKEKNFYELGLKLMRQEHGITEDSPTPSNKRKANTPSKAPKVASKEIELPEIEDDFSVQSECTA